MLKKVFTSALMTALMCVQLIVPSLQANAAATYNNNTVQCEAMTKSGQYTGNINNPFNGVALYANKDSVSFKQYFTYGTHDFTLRACSNNNNMARVDLKIGGQYKGTFYYGGSYPAEYTIKNVNHGTGNKKIELVVTADDGSWDAYLDYFKWNSESGEADVTPAPAQEQEQDQNNVGNQKIIALTFDDGPSSTTNSVLDVLERYNVKATFFLIGQQINRNMLRTMQRQVNMGCELGSHSYTHEDMAKMNATQVRSQHEWTAYYIKAAVGCDVKYFRAPYLSISNTMHENIDATFIAGSTHDDWENYTTSQQIANSVLSSAKDGQIILLHDFQGNNKTVQALPQIIEGLKKQGYTFVTLSELFQKKGVNPNQKYKVWSNVNQ